MTTITFGATGTYANLLAAITYLAGLGAWADDYTVSQVGDSDDFASIEYPLIMNLNGHTLIVECPWANCHQGSMIAGRVINVRQDRQYVFDFVGNGTVVVRNLRIKCTVNGTGANGSFRPLVTSEPGWAYTLSMQDCIIDCNGMHFSLLLGYTYGTTTESVKNIKINYSNGASGALLVGQAVSPYPKDSIVLSNFSFYNCFVGISVAWLTDSSQCIIKNFIFADCATSYSLAVGSAPTITYSADDGDSSGDIPAGTGNVIGFDPAVVFQSIDPTSANFLKLTDGTLSVSATPTPSSGKAPLSVSFSASTDYVNTNPLAKSGIDVGNTEDIGHLAIPGPDGSYSMGCHEAQYA